jgi:2-oxoglutarate ferredoxin oxidoreductase subunit alpha
MSPGRERNIITSVNLDPAVQERHNHKLQAKYLKMQQEEVRFESFDCEDADYVMIAYGCSARICQKSVKLARAKGIKAGLLRPITLFPFPTVEIERLAGKVKGMMAVELSAGQMVEDVRLAANGRVQVAFYGRMGGMVPSPEEVVEALIKNFSIR